VWLPKRPLSRKLKLIGLLPRKRPARKRNLNGQQQQRPRLIARLRKNSLQQKRSPIGWLQKSLPWKRQQRNGIRNSPLQNRKGQRQHHPNYYGIRPLPSTRRLWTVIRELRQRSMPASA